MEPKVEAPSGSGMLGLGSDEIRSFDETNSSFTALLELSTPQAVELLVQEDFPAVKLLPPPPPLPIFPLSKSNNTHFSTSMVKKELPDSDMDSHYNCLSNVKSNKRKEREKKVKESSKRSKKVVAMEGDGEKLPYVHVRARRGQATDSHSLAERARREKINARMKLLQELVPGCNKISGTAMVLDEIINHVQALQREVEFLSMRLAAVSPNIDFNLDDILATESGYPQIFQSLWHEGQNDGINQQHLYQQMCHFGEVHQQSVCGQEEDTSRFITPEPSVLSYDSSANSDTS